MTRQLRRVPPGWEHPRTAEGHFIPLYDETYEQAELRWRLGCADGDWTADPSDPPNPDAAYWRPAWDQEPTWYQLYEEVTEGTPVTPAFGTLAELRAWLLEHGERGAEHCSRPTPAAVDALLRAGWAPSFWFERSPAGELTSGTWSSEPPTTPSLGR